MIIRQSYRIIGWFDGLCIVAILSIIMLPALAATSIPIIGTKYVIDVGDLPAWILALAAVVNIWMVWSLHGKTELIHKETNSMRAALEVAAQAKGKIEGEQIARDTAIVEKETARANIVADAEAAAKVRAIETVPKK